MEERGANSSSKGGVGTNEFVSVLGQGKFGIVYKSERQEYSTPEGGTEAIKVIPKRHIRSAKHANQVLTECRLMVKVKHPNIAGFRGLVHARWNLYIFMEFVGTCDLSKFIQAAENGRLTSKDVLEMFLQVTDAIAFCHHRLIAHRNIKSENIVVAADGIPKLVDLGLAVQLSDPPQLCDDKCGTIPFAPPEVYRNERFEAMAMDVWSLGILVLEMRCGNNSVVKLLGCHDGAEPNQALAHLMEAFFGSPDWPAVVQQTFTGVGMAEELLVILRASLVIAPSLRWTAQDMYRHMVNSSSHSRITGRTSDGRTTVEPSVIFEVVEDRIDLDTYMLSEMQGSWLQHENGLF
jgi:serine/threonine protein kinase